MATTYKTLGIVLASRKARNADRLYTIYTKDLGKIIAQAAGAQKITSKLAGHLEPFSLSQLFLAESRGHFKIAGAQLLNSETLNFKPLNFETLKLLNILVFLLNQLTPLHLKDENIFLLLKNTLEEISQSGPKKRLVQNYLTNLLKFLGLSPQSEFPPEVAKVLKFLL